MKLLWTAILAATFFVAISTASADGHVFEARLSGAQEVPDADTGAKGKIIVKFDQAFTKVSVDLRIKNLAGNFAAAHFHCNRPGVNGSVAFGLVNPGPLTFDGRRIRGTLTNADFTGSDCAGAVGRPVNNIAALAFAMRDGLVYTNVHSSEFPGGEIRGQMLEIEDDDDHDDDDDDDG